MLLTFSYFKKKEKKKKEKKELAACKKGIIPSNST
jgi:hypothetical protein